MPLALIVDDSATRTRAISQVLDRHGYKPERVATLADAKEFLLRQTPDVALLADRVAGEDSLKLIESIQLGPLMELYVMSEDPTVSFATRAMRAGVSDLFQTPVDESRLERNLRDLQDDLDLQVEQRKTGNDGGTLLKGESRSMQKLNRLIRKCAPSQASIFVIGESGTGKELVAQSIHELSARASKPFVALNCSAVTAELMESELFGHKKGSFTGAVRDHKGYFQRASGGTLFLDEITEMAPALQAKMLRVIETGMVRPVGEEKDIKVDVRLVAATNRQVDHAVAESKLREDLYYRLAQFPLNVPSLRERGDDVELLAEHFLAERNAETGLNKGLSSKAREALRLHDWPGNVRELRNAILHGYLLAGTEIDVDDLPGRVVSTSPSSGDYIRLNVATPLAEVERRAILSTLEHFGGDKKQTAAALGVSLKTLYNRLKSYRESS